MAGFGGAVKLTGESEYRRALNQINQSLKETASEMKAVSSAYASNDKSESALTAQTEVLNKKYQEQTQKLNTLQSQYSAMSAQYAQQSSKHTALVNEYDKEKAKLDEIGRTLGTTSQEYQDQKAKVDGLAQEVRKSTQAQDANEKSMSKMRIQINEAQADCNKTARELDNLGKEAERSGKEAEKAGDGFTVFKGILANLGSQAIMGAIRGIKQLGGAFVNAGKEAINGFAQFEQLEGGVKKIFGDDVAQTVIDNANKAFSTAGMSANQYMETVTGFSSSLIQSLDGDTAKATEVADRAIRDMSDNANTFGTSMESIQNAYQGFAKGNFQMLDNLKLGYGGTATEMQRLIKDASEMTDVQKELGITVDANDMSFANIANAISVVQSNMGIMGTTAKEASMTIEGSTNAMKSAWQNMLTGFADENSNFEELAKNFVSTLISEDGKGGVLGTIIPRISQVIEGMSTAIAEGLPMVIQSVVPVIQEQLPTIITALQSALQTILAVLPEVIPIIAELIPQIVNTLISLLPQIVDAGIQLVIGLIQGITEALPDIIAMLPTVIQTIVDTLIENLPMLIDAGLQMILALVNGFVQAIPQLIDYIPTIIESIVTAIIENLPMIIESAVQIIVALVNGLVQALPKLIAMTPKIIVTIVKTLIKNLPQIIQGAVQIVVALVKGLLQSIGKVAEGARKLGKAILDKIKEFPKDMISAGKDLVKGIWEGITGSLDWIKGKIKGWVGNVTKFLKNLFGIASPSKLFRDEIGTNLALGIGVGFSEEMKHVASDMADSIPKSFDVDPTINGGRYASSGSVTSEMVNAFKEALTQVKIVLDDEVAGNFVDKTVTQLIYA